MYFSRVSVTLSALIFFSSISLCLASNHVNHGEYYDPHRIHEVPVKDSTPTVGMSLFAVSRVQGNYHHREQAIKPITTWLACRPTSE